MEKGLIQIYTGDGKGKTTASIGLAVRARSHNLKVCFIYFHKNSDRWNYSEQKILKKLGIDVFAFATSHPYCDKKVNVAQLRKECLKGLDFIKRLYQEHRYDVLILDEILISVRDGFLKEEEITSILKSKPDNLELVLTGRDASRRFIQLADMVSRIEKVKHPYDRGVKRRKGIEY